MESQSEDRPRSELIPSDPSSISDGVDGETAVTLVPAEILQRQMVPHPNTEDLFWESCGGLDAYGNSNYLDLTVVEGDTSSKSQSWRFSQPVVIIGRLEDCDLRLTRREVSRRHAYLQLVGGRWMCVDLGSGNGVRWPSGRHRYGWLEPGGQITIGPYQITSALPNREFALSDPLSSVSPNRERPDVYLEFLNAKSVGGGGNGWALRNRVTLVGSHEVCEMQINDSTVAEFHASLVLTPQGLWVVNLAGDGKTGVNSRSTRWQRLRNGDELQIGRFRLRTHYRSSHADDIQPTPPPQIEQPRIPEPQPAPPPPLHGVSEAFVLQLMGQVANMQQQFMDHSQQQMMMTLQMLAASRAAPPGLSEELARVQELTRELEAMRRQMNRNLTHEPAPAAQPMRPRKGRSSGSKKKRNRHSVPPETSTAPLDSPIGSTASLPQLPVPGLGAAPGIGTPPATTQSVSPTQDMAHQAGQPAMASSGAAAGPTMQPLTPEQKSRRSREEVEMHASLLEGMARLEAERTSTWSRIIKTLMGTPQ